MKRQKRKSKPRQKKQAQPHDKTVASNKKKSRREFFTTASNIGVIAAAVGGVGWFFVSEVCAATREADLDRIGNGIPAVVQIHDPECPSCRALQKETRAALKKFGDTELQYLVANIRTEKGRQLANKHGVGHITLLLFDGQGKRQEILAGQNTSSYLEYAFRQHLARTSRK